MASAVGMSLFNLRYKYTTFYLWSSIESRRVTRIEHTAHVGKWEICSHFFFFFLKYGRRMTLYTGIDEKVILKRILVQLCCGVKSAGTLLVCCINVVNTVTILRVPYKL